MSKMMLGHAQWKRLLLSFYNDRLVVYKDYKNDLSTHAKDTTLTKKEFDQAINFLLEHDLIEIRDDDFYYLKEKGFDIAFELEKQIRENKKEEKHTEIQFSLTLLTLILALTGIATFSIEVFPQYKIYFFFLYLIFVIGFIAGLLIAKKKK